MNSRFPPKNLRRLANLWRFAWLCSLATFGTCAADHVDYFADNGYGNPVSTLQHPAAEASYLGDRLEQIKALPKGTPKLEAKRKKKAGLTATKSPFRPRGGRKADAPD
ncbi:MAG: hypothetical protein FJ399_18745 [Verrucomicrobia bacterium]|nr:hypothetical protein [Verrucomicrobiota bacterium]